MDRKNTFIRVVFQMNIGVYMTTNVIMHFRFVFQLEDDTERSRSPSPVKGKYRSLTLDTDFDSVCKYGSSCQKLILVSEVFLPRIIFMKENSTGEEIFLKKLITLNL